MISVLTQPKGQNPYLDLIDVSANPHMAVTTLGIGSFFQTANIIHIHWPENVFRGSSLRNRIRARVLWTALELVIDRIRRRGGALIWTAHNLTRHEPLSPALAGFANSRLHRFYSKVDLAVAMSATQLPALQQAFPMIPPERWRVVAHPHYREVYGAPQSRRAVRAELGLGDDALLITALGRIRPYKGLIDAIAAFRAVARADEHLLIAGVCTDPAFEAEIAAAASGAHGIMVRIGNLSDVDYAGLQQAADVALFNFSSSLNSGSLLAALSLDRPVLAPRSATFEEMANRNPGWIRLFAPPLRAELLRALLDDLRAHRPAGMPDLSAHAPDLIRQRHAEIYREALTMTQAVSAKRSSKA